MHPSKIRVPGAFIKKIVKGSDYKRELKLPISVLDQMNHDMKNKSHSSELKRSIAQ